MTATLYLTRNGLLEPLGQSQVMAYLRGLSKDYAVTLITYEKDKDRADEARMEAARAECAALGIDWLPQRFRPRPRGIAPALSMMRMLWLVMRETRRSGARLIHARSYIPAAVAMIAGRITGTPFIFDMRALWPEELITAGRLLRGSFLHRTIVAAERACLRRAAGVVSLTHAAVDHLRKVYAQELAGQRIVVIPTCADLDRFVPAAVPVKRPLVHACLGTVLSGWFRLDWLAAWFMAVASRDPEARFEIVTRDDPTTVRTALALPETVEARLTITSSPPQEVHKAVQRHSLSVMFYAGGEISELGRSPTRMAEVLGCGLPVVANAGVGDVARIVTEYRVGVLIADASPGAMERGAAELDELIRDPALPARCRTAAEAVFSLASGTKAYRTLYADILGEARVACAA